MNALTEALLCEEGFAMVLFLDVSHLLMQFICRRLVALLVDFDLFD